MMDVLRHPVLRALVLVLVIAFGMMIGKRIAGWNGPLVGALVFAALFVMAAPFVGKTRTVFAGVVGQINDGSGARATFLAVVLSACVGFGFACIGGALHFRQGART